MGWYRSTTRLAVAGALAALLLAGCSSGKSTSDGGNPSTTVAPATDPSTDLRGLIVTTAPRGYVAVDGEPFGAFSLDRFLADFSITPDADRSILAENGFRGGYARAWANDTTGGVLAVFVFEFPDGTAATSALDRFVDQFVAVSDATPFDVAGVPNAAGGTYLQDTDQGEQRVHQVSFVRRNLLVQVGGQFADRSMPTAEVVSFAVAEDKVLG